MPEQTQARARRHILQGVVVSDKMDKTRSVDVVRRVRDPFYDKVTTRHSRLYVHDKRNESKCGDLVEVAETRPLSKRKRWRLVRIVQKAA